MVPVLQDGMDHRVSSRTPAVCDFDGEFAATSKAHSMTLTSPTRRGRPEMDAPDGRRPHEPSKPTSPLVPLTANHSHDGLALVAVAVELPLEAFEVRELATYREV